MRMSHMQAWHQHFTCCSATSREDFSYIVDLEPEHSVAFCRYIHMYPHILGMHAVMMLRAPQRMFWIDLEAVMKCHVWHFRFFLLLWSTAHSLLVQQVHGLLTHSIAGATMSAKWLC